MSICRGKQAGPGLALLAIWLLGGVALADVPASSRQLPNFLWLTSEDNGPQLGCYGDLYADTPHIDALAARGMRYQNCWSNAPVCAPARTAIITGMFPNSLGAQHMRSEVKLPRMARLLPEYLRELGYYCANHSKEDYNLTQPQQLWDDSSQTAHWRGRAEGQPFFAVFNFAESHESNIRTRPHQAIHDPSLVHPPPYHPDTPEVRRDWAQYYDCLSEMDSQVGKVLRELREDGLEQNTIVFYYGDHGSGMPRGKRWLYESGLRVPLIVHVPDQFSALVEGQYTAGGLSDRLVSFVDLLPTILSLTGTQPPAYLQGHAFLGKFTTPSPPYLYGFRDRMDERYDMSRAVRDQRFAYIRNFFPQRPQGAFLAYMFQTPTTQIWKQRFDAGQLNEIQSAFWKQKPAEELYDLQQDPHQICNLAGRLNCAVQLASMREATLQWMVRIKDMGLLPEGEVFARAGHEAPFALGQDARRFPVEELSRTADIATRPLPCDLPSLVRRKEHPDSGVRYWVANGLLVRAVLDQQREAAVGAARKMTTDSSPYVRCLAQETLARFGTEADRIAAIQALLTMAHSPASSSFVALAALNSLDCCQPTRVELGDQLVEIPTLDTTLSIRYDSYLPSLIDRIRSVAR